MFWIQCVVSYAFTRKKSDVFLVCISIALSLIGCGSNRIDPEMIERAKYHQDLAYGHFFENHDGDAALQEIIKSLKFNESKPESHLLAGLIFTGRTDELSAMKHYKRALELRPDYHEVKNNLGTIHLVLGQWRDAEKIFLELTQEVEYRTPSLGHNNLGWARYKMGQRDSALRSFKTAMQLNPRLCPPYNNAGILHFESGAYDLARRVLSQGVKQCPQYAEPHLHLGRTMIKLRDHESASKHFQRCQKLSPDSEIGIRCERLNDQLN